VRHVRFGVPDRRGRRWRSHSNLLTPAAIERC
jgi:hypothetical protein